MDAAIVSRVQRLIGRRGHVLAGPWAGEIGYELLYWIPFLRKLCEEIPNLRERLTVCSRGGVESWYADVSPRYVELFDLISPEELAERRLELHPGVRRARLRRLATAVGVKHGGEVDEHLARLAAERVGLDDPAVIAPGFVYKLLRGMRDEWAVYSTTLEPRPIAPPPTSIPLPERFVAVRFYAGGGTPGRDDVAATVTRLVEALAGTATVVSVDSGIELDLHTDFPLPGVTHLPPLQPASNLRELTAVVSRADLFVGSYGGFSYIAPHVGVPAVAWLAQPASASAVGEHHLGMIRRLLASTAFGEYLVVTPELAARGALLSSVLGSLAARPD